MKAEHSIYLFCLHIILLTCYLNGQYRIPVAVVGGGGGLATDSTYRVSASSAGQTFVGSRQAGDFREYVGFWPPAKQATPVEEKPNTAPLVYRLDQNYPNPFNPSTKIRFALKERSQVRLIVYNVLGQVVATLVNEELPVGEHFASFSPNGLASGVYLYRVTANEFVQSRGMLLLK